jgi:DNA-binding transcriptional LysR family regulator
MTFEAATRLKSFTAAARELNVSQAAVSRQIRLLENDFGQALFKRGHRRVEPTSAGAMLGNTLNSALDLISETVDSLRHTQGVEPLTIGSTLAFSYFWLLPRLSNFYETRSGLKIRVVSQDEPFDLRMRQVDIVIRFGVPPFSDGKTVAAVSDTFFPVCSPEFASRLKAPVRPEDLLSLPLIGSDAPDPSWMVWSDWFERAGLGRKNPRIAFQFNHYTDGIAAATAGQGVALGWNLILRDSLAKGQLVPLGEPIASEGSYNVLVPDRRRTSEATEAFTTWIKTMFA